MIHLFALAACASHGDIDIYKDDSGVYRFTEKPLAKNIVLRPELALRSSEGHLVTNDEEAKRSFENLKKPYKLDEISRIPDCSYRALFLAKDAQFKAKALLSEKKWNEALNNLTEAEKACPGIERISGQNYWRALAFQGLGDQEKAREAAEAFLTDSAASEPQIYEQSDGPGYKEDIDYLEKENETYIRMRKSAESMLQKHSQLSLEEETGIAKFYPNLLSRPGGNRRSETFFIFGIGYDPLLKTSLGAAVYTNFGKMGFATGYTNSSSTGGYAGAKVWYSAFESAKRDFNLSVFAIGKTFKNLMVTRTYSGAFEEVSVIDSGIAAGPGVGATKRFTQQFGFSGEIQALKNPLNQGVAWDGTLYTFYSIFRGIDLEAGWFHNRPIAGFGLLFAHLGYDFQERSIGVFLTEVDF